MTLSTCQGCRRKATMEILESVLSILDFKFHEQCPTCISEHAETLLAVVRSTNSDGWKCVPKEIRKGVRVFDGESYITVPQWARRMSQQQVAVAKPILDPDDEAVFQHISARLKEVVSKPLPLPAHRPKRSLWAIAGTVLTWGMTYG